MIKMVVTDIDGTILNADGECSLNVRNVIKKLIKNGVKVVLATGRMYRATYPVAEDLEIETPIICYQGGLIKELHGEKKTLYAQYTDENIAKEIIDYFRSKDIHINLYTNDNLWVESDDKYIKDYVYNKNIVYTCVDDLKNQNMDGLNKVLGINDDTKKIENAVIDLKNMYGDKLYVIRSTPTFCEVSNPKASKANALEFLRNYWGFKKDEVLAIGDQDNDIDMVEAAGIGVAMENGTPNLKAKADFITKSIDDDGFYWAMEKFCDV